MTIYFDLSDLGGCVGILANPGDTVVCTGTQVHTEPARYRGREAAERFARENDLHFWFGDEAPQAPFYTVPQTELGGYDSRGGFFAGSLDFTLNGEEPMYYIDREGKCFLITAHSREFAGMGHSWRERMVPSDAIDIFPSLAAAREKYDIHRPRDEGDLMKFLKEAEEPQEEHT